jgi:hypothetical protein
MAGFHKAIDERDIDYADFVWVQQSMTRIYRLGVYPALRGSLLRFDKDNVRPAPADAALSGPRSAPTTCRGGDARVNQDELEQHPVRQRPAYHDRGGKAGGRGAEVRARVSGDRPTVQLLHVDAFDRTCLLEPMGKQRSKLAQAQLVKACAEHRRCAGEVKLAEPDIGRRGDRLARCSGAPSNFEKRRMRQRKGVQGPVSRRQGRTYW